jgi:conjugal transfer pilus assembly protein TraF
MARWIFLLLLSVSPLLYADQLYLNEHEEGWYWHKDPKLELDNKLKQEHVANGTVNKPADPDKTWKLIGKRTQQARAQAILNPTPANVARARRLQRLIVAQANLFSEKWMLDLLLNPDQDESLINPSSSAARDVYNQKNNLLKEQAIIQIGQTSGLLYFYEGGEPFSERMAQVVSDFANSYHMMVIPIAMTNRISLIFPNSRVDSGQASQMGVKHIPAVFALHPASKKTMPVAYGLISQSELKENILLATNAFKSGEYNAQ